jgi:hypothetical protein
MITLTEKELVDVFLAEVDRFEKNLSLYHRPGEYFYRGHKYSMKALANEIERLGGAYHFVVVALRSKDSGSGHTQGTYMRYRAAVHKAKQKIEGKA